MDNPGLWEVEEVNEFMSVLSTFKEERPCKRQGKPIAEVGKSAVTEFHDRQAFRGISNRHGRSSWVQHHTALL